MKRLTFTLSFLALALCGWAQGPNCKDTAEHLRLQTRMWEACNQDTPRVVYQACTDFLHHAREDGDLEAANSSWVCGIMYNLGCMNIHDAYHIAQVMKQDMAENHNQELGKYMISNMIGHVYNTCGNIPGAEKEFLTSMEEIKGTPYERDDMPFIYIALAHVHLNNDLDRTQYWLNEGEKYLKASPESWNYPRAMADVYAIRAIVNFKQKNYTAFRKNLDKMNEVAKKNNLSQGDVFVPYARVYEQVLDGKTEQALAASDSLRNLKEQYLLRCDIYRYIGDYDKAFLIQRELMHKRDSITGIVIAENIDINEKEISLLMEQQKMSKRMNLILWHTVFLALCVIALMTRNILIRRRSRKRLMAKNIELEEANRRVMAADQMKTDFIRSVSHEIRTPLNIINGFTQVLTNEKHTFEPEERNNIAETVNTSTMQITSLVNKMLALANDSTKDLLKEAEATDAHAVCQAALDTMPPVDQERIKVEFEDLTNEHGTIICTHSDSLLQILENMLENSAKFTEEGYIKLTLRNDGRMMWFTVEDTGCGIPEDKISTIFDRFVKVDEFKEGLGLGLAYCHETAEKLGGELTLDHTSEAGTTFTLRLPLTV